jgi:hypothetical protein
MVMRKDTSRPYGLASKKKTNKSTSTKSVVELTDSKGKSAYRTKGVPPALREAGKSGLRKKFPAKRFQGPADKPKTPTSRITGTRTIIRKKK